MYDVKMREKAKRLHKEGLSQQAIGVTLGVSRKTVCYWVNDIYREKEAARRKDPAWIERRKEYCSQYRATRREALKNTDREYYLQNIDAIHAQHKQYRKDHIEETRIRDRRYCRENRISISQKGVQYRKEHHAEILERKKQYRDSLTNEQKEQIKTYMRDYATINRERLREVHKAYGRTVKGRAIKNAAQARRRAVMGKGTGISSNILVTLWEEQNGKCAYCGRQMGLEVGTDLRYRATIDHVIPLIADGKHVKGNVVWACMSCNSSKSDLPVLDWLLEKHGETRAAMFKNQFPEWVLRVTTDSESRLRKMRRTR